jgi:sulfoxide reductase heme-binding subunit YedZ
VVDLSRGRWRHHGLLALGSLVATGLFVLFDTGSTLLDEMSLATAYLCLTFMAVAISLGPLRVLEKYPLALNIYLRRDIGIWAGLTGLVHLFVATELSMSQRYMQLFVNVSTNLLSDDVRTELFSWGSIAGFVVGIFVLILLFLSNDKILRLIGPVWWKRLQRLAYPAFILTVLHGFAFQALESRSIIAIGIVTVAFIGVVILQIFGFRTVRRRQSV